MTWYPQEYIEKVPMTNMEMRANPANGYPGRTYRFYRGPVVFPFGFGLSYTTFRETVVSAPTNLAVGLLSIPIASINSTTKTPILKKNNNAGVRVSHSKCESMNLAVDIDVKNHGKLDGTHTLLVFSSPPPSSSASAAPDKQLIAFEKVHVLAGAKQRTRIQIDGCKHLSVADRYGIRRIPMGDHTLHIGDIKHSISLQVAQEQIKS